MPNPISRRSFFRIPLLVAGTGSWIGLDLAAQEQRGFQLSLHERSLGRMLAARQLDHLDLASIARTQFNLAAVEYASPFFARQVEDEQYLKQMNERAAEHKVRQLLITVEGAGRLGAPDPKQRHTAVGRHHHWVDAAEVLGCHSIEVGISSAGTPEEQLGRVAEGMAMLCEYADKHHINVLAGCRDCPDVTVTWMLQLMKEVDHAAAGVLPTFALLATANSDEELAGLVPFAKGMSAVSGNTGAQGRDVNAEFLSIVPKIIRVGYRGYVGIDYRGDETGEMEGVRTTIALLETAKRDGD